jgi:hypothetical protein
MSPRSPTRLWFTGWCPEADPAIATGATTFVGSLVGLGATKGLFVTTSSFSSQASDFVRHLSQRVILIDGRRLADLMIEHNVGVRIARTVERTRVCSPNSDGNAGGHVIGVSRVFFGWYPAL